MATYTEGSTALYQIDVRCGLEKTIFGYSSVVGYTTEKLDDSLKRSEMRSARVGYTRNQLKYQPRVKKVLGMLLLEEKY